MTDLLRASSTDNFDRTLGTSRTQIVLDTSVLVADPNCLHAYADSDIVIPLIVIEELDGLKTRPDDAGRAARAASVVCGAFCGVFRMCKQDQRDAISGTHHLPCWCSHHDCQESFFCSLHSKGRLLQAHRHAD